MLIYWPGQQILRTSHKLLFLQTFALLHFNTVSITDSHHSSSINPLIVSSQQVSGLKLIYNFRVYAVAIILPRISTASILHKSIVVTITNANTKAITYNTSGGSFDIEPSFSCIYNFICTWAPHTWREE